MPRILDVPPIRQMLGAGLTTPRSVRLWGLSPWLGRHRVALESDDPSTPGVSWAFDHDPASSPDGTFRAMSPEDLRPGTRYRAVVEGPGSKNGSRPTLGPAFVTTRPASFAECDPFRVLVSSCHQPFDEQGRVRDGVSPWLQALARRAAAPDVAATLLLGDQMYADAPSGLSLFDREHLVAVGIEGPDSILDCDPRTVRRLYGERTRQFWGVDGFAELQAAQSCLMMIDDHDIVDNWGTVPDHGTPQWAALRAGALAAARDLQGSRAADPSGHTPELDFTMVHGPMALRVLDLRTHKRHDGEHIFAFHERQLDQLAAFLRDHSHLPVVAIGLSVPLIHAPQSMVRLARKIHIWADDAADRLTAARDSHRLMEILYEHQCHHPRQRLVLLGGDVHVGAATELRWKGRDDLLPMLQLTASPLSNPQHDLRWQLARLSPKVVHRVRGRLSPDLLIEVIPGTGDDHVNPLGTLNVGAVAVRPGRGTEGRTASVRLEMLAPGDGDAGPAVRFLSDWFPAG